MVTNEVKRAGVSLVAVLLATACGTSGDEGGDEVVTTIGAEGGSVSTDDGFELIIPAGALDADLDITVEVLPDRPEFAVGPVYRLSPAEQSFRVPVRVRLPADPIEELPEDTRRPLTGLTAPRGSDVYTELNSIDSGPDYVVAETTHFSSFVAGELSPSELSATELYPRGVACDGDKIYWATGGNTVNMLPHGNQGYVASVPVGGGTVDPLSDVQEEPIDVAVTNTYIFWITGGRGVDDPLGGVDATVMRANKDGSGVATLYSGGYPGALAVDDAAVYWSDRDLGEILTVSQAGGDAQVLATG